MPLSHVHVADPRHSYILCYDQHVKFYPNMRDHVINVIMLKWIQSCRHEI